MTFADAGQERRVPPLKATSIKKQETRVSEITPYQKKRLQLLQNKINSLKNLKVVYRIKAAGYKRLATASARRGGRAARGKSKNFWKQAIIYDKVVHQIGEELAFLQDQKARLRAHLPVKIR